MENKKTKDILLIIMGVLIVAEIVFRLSIIKTNSFSGILILASLIFVALYGFWLYKRPHGNMLKYAMLLLATSKIISNTYYLTYDNPDYISVVLILACATICYGAGRLNRIDQNRILFPLIDLVFLVASIWCVSKYNFGGFVNGFAMFDSFVAFTTLMIAYFVRYKEHKEAGISDK